MSKEEEANLNNQYMLFSKVENPSGGTHAEVFLYDMINHPFFYIELLQFLAEGNEDDTCTIVIDNNGGYLTTGILIAEAIRKSKVQVTTSAISIAASAAAVIYAAGHTKIAHPWGYVMFHTASYLSYGNTKEHKDCVTYIEAVIEAIMVDAVNQRLVTDQDRIDVLSKAKDVFVSGNEINHRLSAGYATLNEGE